MTTGSIDYASATLEETLNSILDKVLDPNAKDVFDGVFGSLRDTLDELVKKADEISGAPGSKFFFKYNLLVGIVIGAVDVIGAVRNGDFDDVVEESLGLAGGTLGGIGLGLAAGAYLGPIGAIFGGAIGAFVGEKALEELARNYLSGQDSEGGNLSTNDGIGNDDPQRPFGTTPGNEGARPQPELQAKPQPPSNNNPNQSPPNSPPPRFTDKVQQPNNPPAAPPQNDSNGSNGGREGGAYSSPDRWAARRIMVLTAGRQVAAAWAARAVSTTDPIAVARERVGLMAIARAVVTLRLEVVRARLTTVNRIGMIAPHPPDPPPLLRQVLAPGQITGAVVRGKPNRVTKSVSQVVARTPT